MTDKEFQVWARQHMALFSLNNDKDAEMVGLWWPMLCDFSLSEMTASSKKIIIIRPGLYRTEQLAALRQYAFSLRLEMQDALDKSQETEGIVCSMCGSTGMAVVPHLRYVRDGKWFSAGNYYPTMSVLCDCSRGRSLSRKQHDYMKENDGQRFKGTAGASLLSMTFSEYKKRNPNWDVQIFWQKDMEAHEKKAKEAAEIAAR